MSHRKNKHLETVALCKNNLLDKCKFSSVKCWWRHTDETDIKKHVGNHITEIIRCYLCQKQFENKRTMMIHRKKEHIGAVKNCYEFQENKCRFSSEDCWFHHKLNEHINQEHVIVETEESVFQEVKQNLKPPIILEKRNSV